MIFLICATLLNKLLQIAGKGKYKVTDNYIYHLRTTHSDKEIFIVTSQRVMYIIQSYWTGSYKVFCITLIINNTVYLQILFKLGPMGI